MAGPVLVDTGPLVAGQAVTKEFSLQFIKQMKVLT